MTQRLPTHLEVAGWRRAVEAAGGFTTVIQRGDRDAGSVLLLTIENGRNPRLWERMPQLDGSRVFTQITKQVTDKQRDMTVYLAQRGEQDGALWIIELDVPQPERFIELRQD
ncbi:DUF1491 family protein [Porphyrobacter sp. GA68]|uniref:DUF1491 family protein n=1 Tax=Porphyrobacter sp. GA68 TaxID=2883480 RepID=UPI001D183108|nr:DUF1491 family protein [Porphyrobacter sp. GA68]